MSSRRLCLRVALVAAALVSLAMPALSATKGKILVYSGSTGYRHESIPAGVAAVKRLAEKAGYTADATEDPEVFTAEKLAPYQALVLVSNSTDPKKPESEWFTGARRDALQAFLAAGKGVVGLHAAADSHYHWGWYQQMIGGHFAKHPPGTPEGTLTVIDKKHRANKGVALTMRRIDEWYYFDDYDPRSTLLVTLDPQSIGEKDVNPNPVSWAREFEGGRVFYTAMGHTPETYSDPNFLNHLAGGLAWVLKRK